jgi:hypothetical protein
MEKKLKQKRLEMLEDTCKHYNSLNRSQEQVAGLPKACKYFPVSDKTEGCAIGRLIKDKELCKEFDNTIGSSVNSNYIFKKLPTELQDLGQDFLRDVQRLHDNVLVLEERYDQLGNVLYKRQLEETGYSTEKFDARGNFTFTRSYKLRLNMLTPTGEPRLKYLYWKKFEYDNLDRLIYTLENNGWWENISIQTMASQKLL